MLTSIARREFLSAEECKAIFNKIVGMASGGGDTKVFINSQHSGSAKWARNRIHVASDIQSFYVSISRLIRGAKGSSSTSVLNDEGLLRAVREAESFMQVRDEFAEHAQEPFVNEPILKPTLWSEGTYGFGADQRTDLVQNLMSEAEAAGMMSAGNLLIAANGTATMSTEGMFFYYPQTVVECSMTVRHPTGISSGWAGINHYDLERIDPKALAARALDKCIRSQTPVAVEPGRYTVIMEPQATADLFRPIIKNAMGRRLAEQPAGPFGKEPGRSKINEQVLDGRLVLRSDPMDPDGGFIPYERIEGTPYRPVNWIERGMLKELSYDKSYALSQLGLDKALSAPDSFRLTPAPGVPTTTVEDMIAKTERGILVTRFSGVQVVDTKSMLCAGYTRDGLWLIERGKITKAIKNFRFTESPLFALNSIEDMSMPQRVFTPGTASLAPAVRVRDFSFAGLADAI